MQYNGLLYLYQKEKEKNKELEAKKQIAENTVYSIQNDLMLKNGEEYFVPKSKIKAKIEEYKARGYEEATGALQELLEEEG